MKDQEFLDEKVGNVHDVKVDLETVDPEYHDYLALSEEYQGEKLKQLTVSMVIRCDRRLLIVVQRKIDWRVVPQLIFIYMLSYVDRANVGNAKLFGAQADTGLSATDWNIGLSLLCE